MNEPVVFAAIARAVAALIVAGALKAGVHLDVLEVTAFVIAGETALAAWVRSKSTPNTKVEAKVESKIDAKMAARGTSAGIVFLVLLLAGCSSLGHAKDPTVDTAIGDACSLLASQNKPALEAEAQKRGLTVDQVVDIFKTACKFRMRAALAPATREGFAAAAGDAGAYP